MLFEYDPINGDFHARFNGETVPEIIRLAQAIGILTVGDQSPPIVIIQGVRTMEGRLAADRGPKDVSLMTDKALDSLPPEDRSGSSIEFSIVQSI